MKVRFGLSPYNQQGWRETSGTLRLPSGGDNRAAVVIVNAVRGGGYLMPINSMVLGKDGADMRQTFGIGRHGDPIPTLGTAHHHAVARIRLRIATNVGGTERMGVLTSRNDGSPNATGGGDCLRNHEAERQTMKVICALDGDKMKPRPVYKPRQGGNGLGVNYCDVGYTQTSADRHMVAVCARTICVDMGG